MALAGVPESEWPEYEGSGEERSAEDEEITRELRERFVLRREAALAESTPE